MAGFWNQNPLTFCEYTGPPLPNRWEYGQLYPPMSRAHCTVNILSTDAMVGIRDHWLANGTLVPITVETGGGYVVDLEEPEIRSRWPSRQTYINTNASNWTPRANSIEWGEIVSYWDSNPNALGARRPTTHVNARVNPSALLWRLSHESRPIPVTAEISHCAESYQRAEVLQPLMPIVDGQQRQFRDHWRVEVTELEADWININRQFCTRTAAMWRKPDGMLIAPEEVDTYTGPTMCVHGRFGQPCYGPYPGNEIEVICTGTTPARRKIGRSSMGEGGREYTKRGRKTACEQLPLVTE